MYFINVSSFINYLYILNILKKILKIKNSRPGNPGKVRKILYPKIVSTFGKILYLFYNPAN